MKSPQSQMLSKMNRGPPGDLDTLGHLDHYYGLVKRQLVRYQSPTSHLYPDKSTNQVEAHLRDSIYCSAAVWSLYQVWLFTVTTNLIYWFKYFFASSRIGKQFSI